MTKNIYLFNLPEIVDRKKFHFNDVQKYLLRVVIYMMK